MNKQSKAIWLADFLDHIQGCAEAAAELRRLHEVEKKSLGDQELLKRIYRVFLEKGKWSGNPKFGDRKAYVATLIVDYANVVLELSDRIDDLKKLQESSDESSGVNQDSAAGW